MSHDSPACANRQPGNLGRNAHPGVAPRYGKGGRGVAAQRLGTLLVPVPGLSGTTYPPGTTVTVRGRGATVDAFVNGDWLPLSWWEFSDGLREDIADR